MTSYTMGYSSPRGKERRKDRRLPLPIFTVRLDGQVYHTVNWSLGGLLVEAYAGERKEGEAVEIDIKAKDATADFRMQITAKVIRVIPGEALSLQFEAMSPALYEFFERCFAARFKR
jgi:PilZ domain